jgi:hypothetical protein
LPDNIITGARFIARPVIQIQGSVTAPREQPCKLELVGQCGKRFGILRISRELTECSLSRPDS